MEKVTRTNLRNAGSFIRNREAFAAGGNAYGEPNFRGNFPNTAETGRLSYEEAMQFAEHMLSMDFVVYSYGTPIAWHYDNGWYLVEQKFSSSTGRHQSTVRNALIGYV